VSAVIIFCLLSGHHCSLHLVKLQTASLRVSQPDPVLMGVAESAAGKMSLFVEDTLQDALKSIGMLWVGSTIRSQLCVIVLLHKLEVYRYATAARDCL